MNERYAFINSEEGGKYSVQLMCRCLQVSRSGYYKWQHRTPSATARRRSLLTTLVRRSFTDSDGTYGYRRVHADLVDWGYPCQVETVRSIMAELGLVACQPRAYKVTTRPGQVAAEVPDRLQRDFTAQAPGTTLVGDITYVKTWAGWLYLATVIDCCTKMIIGYAMAPHMRTQLVTDALEVAYRAGRVQPGAVFHSDRGSQYTSAEFAAYAEGRDLLRSMGKVGSCFDNAYAESVNATLKVERINRTVYPTREHAIRDITRYIELRYNTRRRHSALGYRTPAQAENDYYTTKKAA